MPSVRATLRESFSQRDHSLIVQSMGGEGKRLEKMNSSHHQVRLVERGLLGLSRAKVKTLLQTQLASDHTHAATCEAYETMKANIAAKDE